MNRILKTACLLAFGACVLGSCAKTDTEEANQIEKRYLDAWLAINYPGATEKNGIYVIEETPGTGSTWTSDLSVNFVTYTIRGLDGSVSTNTDEAWARQMGNWNPTYYYGKQVLITGEKTSYAGLDILLEGMRAGGTKTAVIPSWMMTLERYGKTEDYMEHETGNNSAIYTVTLLGQTRNLADYEYEELSRYSAEKWGVTDTLSTAAVFFKSHSKSSILSVEMPADTTVYINYTGRRISDGQVFDTTVADTAKFYGIYNSSKTYEPVSVSLTEDLSNISMSGSTKLISGFKYGLKAMHPDESASFAFGYSLGYGSSSSGNLIPAYAALRFDVDLVPAP